jgi:hypothetical protein
MIDPDAPVRLLPPPPPHVEGAGPEQAGLAAARHQTAVAIWGSPVPQALRRPYRRADIDVRSPQVFVVHPRVQLLAQTNLGADIAWPRVPGRAPAPGWDGEPGAHAPLEAP